MTRPSSKPPKPPTIEIGSAYKCTLASWNNLNNNDAVPVHVHCPVDRNNVRRTYGQGQGYALYQFLTGRTEVRGPAGLGVTSSMDSNTPLVVEYGSTAANPANGSEKNIYHRDGCWGGSIASVTAPYHMALAMAVLLDDRLTHSHSALVELLTLTQKGTGQSYPFSDSPQLKAMTDSDPYRDAVLKVCDALYFELKEAIKTNRTLKATEDPQPVNVVPLDLKAMINTMLRQNAPKKIDVSVPGGHSAEVRSVIRRGGSVLMVGPKGTYKTSTATEATIAEDAKLVVVRGAPGIEDADLMGGVYPDLDGGFSWRDGPITKAFALAAVGRTVLLVDECLRFHAAHFNKFIGLLDHRNRAECLAMGIPANQLLDWAKPQDHLDRNGQPKQRRYYLTTLSTGVTITCPSDHLTFIFTTNIGEGYMQTANDLDEAFISRQTLILEVTESDRDKTTRLLEAACSNDLVVTFTLDLMDMLQREYNGNESVFKSYLDARKGIALVETVQNYLDEAPGTDVADAFMRGVLSVVAGAVCERDVRGRLTSVEALIDMVRKDVLG